MNEIRHISVLVEEVLQNLVSAEVGLFVDATLGGGGHTYHLLNHYRKLRIVGIDADEVALDIARNSLSEFRDRVTLVRGNFRDLKEILQSTGISSIDGILFDLGTSAYQVLGKRGFSFHDDEALDMRMDTREGLTASDIVNRYREVDLANVLYNYGEEEKSRRIAKVIVEARKKGRINSAKQLADLVSRVKRRTGRIHPATKTFQALRIETNRELTALSTAIQTSTEVLNHGARIGIISFHSLEDRIVKESFRNSPYLNILTKKPIRPQRSEVMSNPRARSAKLRVAEKQ